MLDGVELEQRNIHVEHVCICVCVYIYTHTPPHPACIKFVALCIKKRLSEFLLSQKILLSV